MHLGDAEAGVGMSVRGRKPVEDRSQVRNRMPVLDWWEVPDVPFDGPRLPTRYEIAADNTEREIPWPTATLRWWETVRVMPHCKRWTPSDWEFAFGCAEAHARLMKRGTGFAEMKIREARLGMTHDARCSMRIRYVSPSAASVREEAEPVAAPVVQMADFRDMYGAGA